MASGGNYLAAPLLQPNVKKTKFCCSSFSSRSSPFSPRECAASPCFDFVRSWSWVIDDAGRIPCLCTCSVGRVLQIRSFADKPGMLPVHNARRLTSCRSCFQGMMVSEKFIYSPQKQKGVLISCSKTTEALKTENSSDLYQQQISS